MTRGLEVIFFLRGGMLPPRRPPSGAAGVQITWNSAGSLSHLSTPLGL